MRRAVRALALAWLLASVLIAGSASAAGKSIPANTVIHRVAAVYGEKQPHVVRLQRTRTDSSPSEPMYFIALSGHFHKGKKKAVYLSFSALADRSYVWGVLGQDSHHHEVWLDPTPRIHL